MGLSDNASDAVPVREGRSNALQRLSCPSHVPAGGGDYLAGCEAGASAGVQGKV